MNAIFKREIKAYFNSPFAYVLIGLFILLSSLFFFISNMAYQSADFSSDISTMGFVLLFITPILTMRILAEDRKNGTEVLLITSPVNLTSIVLGKYFVAIVVFLVMTAITFIYPIILFIFAKPALAPLIGSYIGFLLLGASFIAVGVFASSLSENQVVTALISFVSLLIIWLIEPIGNSVGGVASKVLNWFSLLSRYNDFNVGILNLSSVIYYLSFIAVFLFLTIRVIEKRRWSRG